MYKHGPTSFIFHRSKVFNKLLMSTILNLFVLQFRVVQEDPQDVAVKHSYHMVLFRCSVPPGRDLRATFEPLVGYKGEECYFNDHNRIQISLCRQIVFVWSLGARVRILLNT